jgi:hypothetical protein
VFYVSKDTGGYQTMSFKKTLIFFIILLLLGGYYYIFEIRIAEKKQAAEEAEKRLFQFQEDDIQEIIVKRSDQEIGLKKQDDVWKMVQPVAASADIQNVKDLITTFVDAERDKMIVEKSSDDQEFGLDNPELVVTAKIQESDTDFQLSIGKETPTASGFYARVGAAPAVITINTSVKTSLDKTMYDLRDKTILDFDPAQVKQTIFTIKNPDSGTTQEIRLEQADDLWKIVSPKEFKADTTKMVSLLSKVKSSRIKEFIEEDPENLAQYKLDQPDTTLSLVVGDDNTRKILLLGKTDEAKDGIYAKYEAAKNVFFVPTDLVKQFPKNVNDLRDKTLLTFNNEDVQKIELISRDETVVLEHSFSDQAEEKSEGEWKIIQPGEFKADDLKVQNLLSDARGIHVEQFVTDEPIALNLYGLESPQITLNLWEKDQEKPQQLLLGNADVENTGVYAKLGDQDSLVLVKTDALEQLKKTAFDLRYKRILSFTQNQIKKIQIKYPETIILLEKDGDVWKAKEPEKKELLPYKVNNLIYDLGDLEFKEEILTPEEDLSVYGLHEPQVEVTLWEENDREVFTLLAGKQQENADVLYVKIMAENTVYAIDSSFLDEFPKDLKDLTE